MMSPAATVATPLKPGMFDVATLFVSDKASRDEAAASLAAATKKDGVELIASIGLVDELLKVSQASVPPFSHPYDCSCAPFPEKLLIPSRGALLGSWNFNSTSP